MPISTVDVGLSSHVTNSYKASVKPLGSTTASVLQPPQTHLLAGEKHACFHSSWAHIANTFSRNSFKSRLGLGNRGVEQPNFYYGGSDNRLRECYLL